MGTIPAMGPRYAVTLFPTMSCCAAYRVIIAESFKVDNITD